MNFKISLIVILLGFFSFSMMQRKDKTYKMKFKVRDGLEIPNRKFYIDKFIDLRAFKDGIGYYYPSSNFKRDGRIVLKEPVPQAFEKYFDNAIPKSEGQKPVVFLLKSIDCIVREEKPDVGANLNMSFAIKFENQLYHYSFARKRSPMIGTGATINKMIESIMEEGLNQFNEELLK